MVFDTAAQAGKSVKEVEVPGAERDRFSLTDDEIHELARYAVAIERHYGRPMDIEWGRDGYDGKLYILQARPETVKSQETAQATRSRATASASAARCSPRAAPSARRSARARCA